MLIKLKNKDTLTIDDFKFKCCIGKNGISSQKIEGDNSTPKGKFKIGVFGLGIELNGLVDPKMYGKTSYTEPIKEAQNQAKFLRENKGCNLIICLSHLGLKYDDDKVSDIVIAKQCSEIDIIIGGHTHNFLKKPIEIVSNSGKYTYINQVGWAGLNLGRIDVTLKPGLGEDTYVCSSLNI